MNSMGQRSGSDRRSAARRDFERRLADRRVFDGPRILIVKPALRGQWTRTAALNDATQLYAHIAEARQKSAAQRATDSSGKTA